MKLIQDSFLINSVPYCEMPQDKKEQIDKAAEILKEFEQLILSFKEATIDIISISPIDDQIKSSFPKDLSDKMYLAYQKSLN